MSSKLPPKFQLKENLVGMNHGQQSTLNFFGTTLRYQYNIYVLTT